ncbi:MAG: histidine kinase [Chthoniobacterales bacterium]
MIPLPPLPASAPTVLLRVFATAAAILAASYIAVRWAMPTDAVFSPWWPASGIALAAVIAWGPWMLAGIYAGTAASNALWDLASPLTWFGPFGLMFEAGVTALLLRRFLGPNPRPFGVRACLAFLLAPWIPVALNGLYGFQLLQLGGAAAPQDLLRELSAFIPANGFGSALVAPALLAWQRPRSAAWWKRFAWSVLACAAVLAFAFITTSPAFLLVIPLLLAAAATGLTGAATITAATVFVIISLTSAGFGPFASEEAMFRFDYFLALLAFGVLPVGALCGEYRRLLQQRQSAEQAAGLRFWEWSGDRGTVIEGGSDEPEPERLFDPEQDRGCLETRADGHEALSFWQTSARDAEGRPREVSGVLVDVSDRIVLERMKREAWQSEVELRNLRAGLAPHLLFNCLAAVRGIVRTDPERARTFIDHLSRFLRDSTNAQERETVPLLDEWQLCEDFLALQSMRFERELPRLVEIEGTAYHARIPPMMLLNLVENAVKHGEISQRHPLAVSARLRDGFLEATVRNHGRLGPMPVGRPGGLGVARARLKAVYGTDGSLDIGETDGDVVAAVRFPAKPAAEPS